VFFWTAGRLFILSSDTMRIRTLSGILAFLLAGAVLVCALHLVVNAGMRRIRFGMFGALNRAADGRVNADIIVTGSSRASLHYDPAILGRTTGLSAFNLGLIGSWTNVHAGILRLYLHHNRPPRLVIENLDLYSLGANGAAPYDIAQYTPYLCDSGLYEAMHRRYPMICRSRYLPLYGYISNDLEFQHYLGLKALFGIQPPEGREDGYRPRPNDSTDAFGRVKAPTKEQRFNADPRGVADLEDFLSIAQSRGIPTILVFSPMYYEHLAMVVNRTQLMAGFAGIAERHGAVFWDLSDLAPISGNTWYFSDSMHMNTRGASAFSEVLGRRLAAWLADHH
jgi:hypothetical protein